MDPRGGLEREKWNGGFEWNKKRGEKTFLIVNVAVNVLLSGSSPPALYPVLSFLLSACWFLRYYDCRGSGQLERL